MILTQTLPKAWNLFWKHKHLLLLVLILEAAFFVSVVRLHYSFFVPTSEAALRATEAMQKEFENTPNEELHLLDETLSQNPEFMASYFVLVENIIYFLLGTLLLWIVFRGPLWYLSHRSVRETPFLRFMAKFAGMTLFWAATIALAVLGYSIIEGSTATILPIVSSTTASALFIALLLVIFYFQQLSYALLTEKQTFKNTFIFGIKQWKKAVPVWIVSSLITFIALTLPMNWVQSLPQASLALYALLSVPALDFARVNMIVPWSKK